MLRIILLLIIALAIPPRPVSPQETINCRNWCDSHCGQVRLSKQCEFNDGNFKRIVGSKNDCPGFCLEDVRCNHFYWLGNTCYLKRTAARNTTSTKLASESLADSHKIATLCGYVVQRVCTKHTHLAFCGFFLNKLLLGSRIKIHFLKFE